MGLDSALWDSRDSLSLSDSSSMSLSMSLSLSALSVSPPMSSSAATFLAAESDVLGAKLGFVTSTLDELNFPLDLDRFPAMRPTLEEQIVAKAVGGATNQGQSNQQEQEQQNSNQTQNQSQVQQKDSNQNQQQDSNQNQNQNQSQDQPQDQHDSNQTLANLGATLPPHDRELALWSARATVKSEPVDVDEIRVKPEPESDSESELTCSAHPSRRRLRARSSARAAVLDADAEAEAEAEAELDAARSVDAMHALLQFLVRFKSEFDVLPTPGRGRSAAHEAAARGAFEKLVGARPSDGEWARLRADVERCLPLIAEVEHRAFGRRCFCCRGAWRLKSNAAHEHFKCGPHCHDVYLQQLACDCAARPGAGKRALVRPQPSKFTERNDAMRICRACGGGVDIPPPDAELTAIAVAGITKELRKLSRSASTDALAAAADASKPSTPTRRSTRKRKHNNT